MRSCCTHWPLAKRDGSLQLSCGHGSKRNDRLIGHRQTLQDSLPRDESIQHMRAKIRKVFSKFMETQEQWADPGITTWFVGTPPKWSKKNRIFGELLGHKLPKTEIQESGASLGGFASCGRPMEAKLERTGEGHLANAGRCSHLTQWPIASAKLIQGQKWLLWLGAGDVMIFIQDLVRSRSNRSRWTFGLSASTDGKWRKALPHHGPDYAAEKELQQTGRSIAIYCYIKMLFTINYGTLIESKYIFGIQNDCPRKRELLDSGPSVELSTMAISIHFRLHL